MLTDTQIDAYFKRIGFEGRVTNSKHTLDELVLAHQCTIPFETVTLHRRGGKPRLETELIFEKVVERELGGYCFELNKLFEELLASLGFEVRPALSRAVRGRGAACPSTIVASSPTPTKAPARSTSASEDPCPPELCF